MLKKIKTKNIEPGKMADEIEIIEKDNNDLNQIEEKIVVNINEEEDKKSKEEEKIAKKEFKERYSAYATLIRNLYGCKPKKSLDKIMNNIVDRDIYNLTDKDAWTRVVATFNVGCRLFMIKPKEAKKYLISAYDQLKNEELLIRNENAFKYLEDTLLNLQRIYIMEDNFKEASRLNGEYMNIVKREKIEKINPMLLEYKKNGSNIKEIDLMMEYRKKHVEGQKVAMKILYRAGHKFEAEELYRKILNESGIILTDEAYDLSIKEGGIENGQYILIANGVIYRKNILGNEKYLLTQELIKKEVSEEINISQQTTNEEEILIDKNAQKDNILIQDHDKNVKQEPMREEVSEEINISQQKTNEEETLINEDVEKDNILIQNYDKDINQELMKKEVLQIIETCKEENATFEEVVPIKLIYVASYLKNYDDNEVKEEFKTLVSKIEELISNNDFIEKIEKLNINLNIGVFDKLYVLYKDGLIDNKGEVIVPRDKETANRYLSKELEYLGYLKNKAENKTGDSIENLINESKYSSALEELKSSELKKKLPAMNLILSAEVLKRIPTSFNYNDLISKISRYKEKIKSKTSISIPELETLGDILYNGIQDCSGNTVLTADKIVAKDVYSKLISEYGDSVSTSSYNRLYNLYNDNTLPIYDLKKAEKLKKRMIQKGIEIKNEEQLKNNLSNNSHYTYVCSDLHGNYEVYKAILEKLRNKDKLYILGDVIDRGPDGIKILQDIIKRKENGQVEFLVGNHEYMMIQSLFLNNQSEKENWENRNGGEVTRKAFEKLTPKEQVKIKDFLLNSYVYKNIMMDSHKVHLVHAKAVQDSNEDTDKTVIELLKEGKENIIKKAVWYRGGKHCSSSEIAKQGVFTIIGHTPTESQRIEYKNGYLDIDCGMAYNQNAALINLEKGNVLYINDESIKQIEKTKIK